MNFVDLIKTTDNRHKRRAETAARRKVKKSSAQLKYERMQRKYEELKGPALITNQIYTWSGDFFRSGPLADLNSRTSPSSSDFTYDKMTGEAMKHFSKPSRFIKVVKSKKDKKTGNTVGGSVMVRMAAPTLQVNITCFNDYNRFGTPEQQQASMAEALRNFKVKSEKIEKQLRKLFPNFRFPDSFRVDSGSTGGRKVVPNLNGTASPLMKIDHLEKIAGTLGKEFRDSEVAIVDGFPEFDPQMSTYEQGIELQYSIDEKNSFIGYFTSAQLDKLEDMSKEEKDSVSIEKLIAFVTRGGISINLSVGIDLYMRYPLDYAIWATSARDEDDFNPVLFTTLHNMRVDKSINQRRASSNPPAVVSDMDKVANSLRARQEEYKFEFKPRTNKEDLCATRTGQIIWAPKVNNAKEYTDLNKSLHDPETGEIREAGSVPALVNRVVLTDWGVSKLTYTKINGEITYIDISGAGPLSDQSVFNYINNPIAETEAFNKFFQNQLSKIVPEDEAQKVIDKYKERMSKEEGSSNNFFGSLSEIYFTISGWKKDITIAEIANPRLIQDDFPKERYLKMHYCCYIIAEICDIAFDILKNPDSKVGVSMHDRIHGTYFAAAAMSVYAKKYDELAENYGDKVRRNRMEPDMENYSLKVPNLPGLEFIMPHQKKWMATLEQAEPDSAFISVAVGGGKAIMGIADAVKVIEKEKAKRALIVMPENLLSQYAREIIHFSQGKLNPFIINKETIEALMKNTDFDDKKFVKLVRGAPKNTIFITSYDWLKGSDSVGLTRNTDEDSAVLIKGNEMIYGPFSMGSKTGGRYPGAKIFPMVDLMSRCEFDFIGLDESHKAKETQTSDIAIAPANLMSQAKIKRFLSGTIVTDKPIDLVGPMSMIAPEILGSKDAFKDRFMKKGTLLPGVAPKIQKLLSTQVLSIFAAQQEWAFIMPDIVKTKISAEMSSTQAAFYDTLMRQALAKFNEEIELLLGSGANADDIDEMFKKLSEGEDGKSEDEDGEGPEEDEELQKKIEDIAKRALSRVEIFLAAPDEDKAPIEDEDEGVNLTASFKNFNPKPKPSDLISPKAKATYAICNAHFFGTPFEGVKKDETEYNKVVIFGYNKAVSRHIMRHMPPELKKMAIRYVASRDVADNDPDLVVGKEALARFMNDPKLKILVADETSMAEGFNLQMASRMIRVQTVWSPGKQEQVEGRVLRPDPKGKYKREQIFVNLLSASHPGGKVTVDDAKIARMLSKIIAKARIDYRNNSDWQNDMEFNSAIEGIGVLSMNLEKIDNMKQEDLYVYEEATRVYNAWLASQYEKKRQKYLKEIQKTYPDATMEDVRILAMSKVEQAEDLKGSSKYFIPTVFGQNFHDEYGLDLVPIVEADIDGDEDDGEGVPVEDGQPCMTAFGPGYIKTQFTKRAGGFGKTISVDIPGLGKISVGRGAVSVASTETGRRRFENLMALLGEDGAPTMDKEGNVLKPRKITADLDRETKKLKPFKELKPSKVEEDFDLEDDEDEDDYRDAEIDDKVDEQIPVDDKTIYIDALSVAGMPTLWLRETDEKIRAKFMRRYPEWKIVPPYYAMKVKNHKGFRDIIDLMVDNFDVSPKRVDYLTEAFERMKGQRGKLIFEGKAITNESMRNFFKESHRKIRQPKNKSAKMKISPWLLIWDGVPYICFDEYSHPVNFESKMRIKSRRVPGVADLVLIPSEPGMSFIMNFYHSKRDASNALKQISEHYDIDEYKEVIEDLKAAVTLRQKPKEEPLPTAKKSARKPVKKAPAKKLATKKKTK